MGHSLQQTAFVEFLTELSGIEHSRSAAPYQRGSDQRGSGAVCAGSEEEPEEQTRRQPYCGASSGEFPTGIQVD